MFLYFAYCYLTGPTTPTLDAWVKFNLPVRVLIVSLVGLILLSHVQLFGKVVFGVIPKSVGGGKPEKAFLHLDPQHASLVSALNFSTANQTIPTNNIVGPIGILLHSEKELIFVDYAQLTAAASLTNIVTNTVLLTKLSTGVQTNLITNSIVNLTTNVVKNPLKFGRAKQVRAEIVDAVIYSE
jgi:hypothetical protein